MSESFFVSHLLPRWHKRDDRKWERGMTNGTGPNRRVGTLCSSLALGNKFSCWLFLFFLTFLQGEKFFSTTINWASNKGLQDWKLQLVCDCDGQPSVVRNRGVWQRSHTHTHWHQHVHAQDRTISHSHTNRFKLGHNRSLTWRTFVKQSEGVVSGSVWMCWPIVCTPAFVRVCARAKPQWAGWHKWEIPPDWQEKRVNSSGGSPLIACCCCCCSCCCVTEDKKQVRRRRRRRRGEVWQVCRR